MPFEVAIIIAIFILVTTLVVMMVLITSRRQAAKEEEMKRAASARGWKFESVRKKGYRVYRWTGSTDGVSWVAESLARSAGSNNRQERRRHIARWQGNWSPGINGAIVAIGFPKGKEDLGKTILSVEGWFFAALAKKAAGYALDKAIDVYFGEGPGKEVDARVMHRLETKTPGFIVVAKDKDEGSRIMSQGLEKALVDASNDKTSVLSNEDRPWLLLRPNTISLARMERFRDITEVESFVRAGVALTRTSKFGRAFA